MVDLVVTNASERISTVHNIIDKTNHSSSDHFMISMNLNFCSSKSNTSSFTYNYMYARADFSAMSNYILDHQTIIASNIDETWSNLKHLVLEARYLFVPKFKIPKKSHPKWFNSVVRHQINCTRTLRKKYRLKSTVTNQSKLLMAETELQNAILTAKEQYNYASNSI